MDQNEIIVGLDIGTTKIAIMVGRKNDHGKIEILGMGKAESVGVMRGMVMHLTPTIDSIRTAIEEAEAKAGIEIKVVNVGIAGQHIKSHQHRGKISRADGEEEITQKDIDDLIEDVHNLNTDPGEKIIHVLPQEYIVGNEFTKNPIGMVGKWLEANCHVITGHLAAANHLKKCVEKAGLEIAELTLEPLASSASVLSSDEKEAGVVLVDIGGGTTDIAIFEDHIIRHTAVIPFGGNVITEDIKEGCSIIRKQAEQLKVKFGSALASENQENEIVVIPGLKGRDPKEISVKNLANIIQARMEEIIEQIYFEIKNSGFENKLSAGIVVTGGGSQMKHLPQLMEFMTGMDTRIGYPTEYLANGAEEVTSPMYATGVGLVVMGIQEHEKSRNTISGNGNIANHSKLDKGNFFKILFSNAKRFFDEDADNIN